MKKAKAAVLHDINKPMTIEEFEISEPERGQALVKMQVSGVCGTDLHQYHGRLTPLCPIVLGHEMAGVVDSISETDSAATGLKKGDKVLTSVAVPCGKCRLCKMGHTSNCLDFGCTYARSPYEAPHLFGGYAEYAYFPVTNLFKVPEKLPIRTAGIFACGGPTVLNAFKHVPEDDLKETETAVVQGTGPVGMFSILYLKMNGVKNIVVIGNRKFDEARERVIKGLGATHLFTNAETSEEERLQKIMEMTGGIGADLVVEASGNNKAFPEGLNLLRNCGTYLVPGQYSNTGGVLVKPEIITFKALRVLGASQYAASDVKRYIELMAKHPELWAAVDAVNTHQFKVEEANEAIAAQERPDSIKVLLVAE